MYVDNSVKRGDIFYADLSPVVGSEQGGVRPVLIVQNDTGNRPDREGQAAHPYPSLRPQLRIAQGLHRPAGADPHPG